MSGNFVAASSQRLTAPTPITAYPVSVGMWIRPVAAAGQSTWTIGSATASQMFRLLITAGGQFSIGAEGGGASQYNPVGSFAANTWNYVVGRFISATNRRLAVLNYQGATAYSQGTTSVTPTNLDEMQLGARKNGGAYGAYLDGMIAEYWVTNTDIQADGAQLQESTLRQLAYQGPFSLPHIAKDIIEYRSFRSRIDSRADTPDEVYHRGTRQVWTNTNGVTLGPHPPAAENYVSPLTEQAPMVIV